METKQNRIKILLVDDDEIMRIYFRDVFWIHGQNDTYEVLTVASIEEAEEKLKEKDSNINTVFLDAMMPIGGEKDTEEDRINRSISFIQKIKENKDSRSTKIIILLGQEEKSIKNVFDEVGVDGYLIKGEFMPKEIIAFTNKIHELNY